MDTSPKLILIFRTNDGKRPFIDWIQSLKDQRAKQKIQLRLDRLSLGNLGQTNSVGEGVQELKIDYGPGYRVYFGMKSDVVVILLIGGDKSTQVDDIRKARAFWKLHTGGL